MLCAFAIACVSEGSAPVPRTVSVRVLDRALVAIDAGGREAELLALEPGERVLSHEARGRIGIAVTNRRLAGYTAASGWSERRLRISEATPSRAELGTRVALFLTSQRAIGFDGHWREVHFGLNEDALQSSVDAGAVVVVTNLRALALSEGSRGFHPIAIRAGEHVENVYAGQAASEVRTTERVLTFEGSWSEARRRVE